jgi:hypothetical protein
VETVAQSRTPEADSNTAIGDHSDQTMNGLFCPVHLSPCPLHLSSC